MKTKGPVATVIGNLVQPFKLYIIRFRNILSKLIKCQFRSQLKVKK